MPLLRSDNGEDAYRDAGDDSEDHHGDYVGDGGQGVMSMVIAPGCFDGDENIIKTAKTNVKIVMSMMFTKIIVAMLSAAIVLQETKLTTVSPVRLIACLRPNEYQ